MLIDGEKTIDFMVFNKGYEVTVLKSMRIIDFLENYSADTVPTIDIPTDVTIVVHEDGTVRRITGVKI